MNISNTPESFDRSLACYMREISHTLPLSSGEEAELAYQIQTGDVSARNVLVRASLRFVVRIAREYRHQRVSLEELISVGNVGLLKAAERFDGARGYRFITYAVWWVRQAIHEALAEQRTVRLPQNRIGLLRRIFKSSSSLQQELLADPAANDVAKDLGVTLEEVERTLIDGQFLLALDAPLNEEFGQSSLQTLADQGQAPPDQTLDQEQIRQDISAVLDTLTQRESTILRLYFGLGEVKQMTLEQIGLEFGLTRERVRQIKKRGVQKLRHAGRARRLKPYLESTW